MKTLTWSLMLLLIAASAMAEPGPPLGGRDWEPPSPEHRAQRLSEELSLDEKQAASLLEIFTAADAEREAMREKHEKAIREDMCSHKDKISGQIKSLLTEQQSAEFDRLMASKEARREEHRSHREMKGGKGRMPFVDCEDPAS